MTWANLVLSIHAEVSSPDLPNAAGTALTKAPRLNISLLPRPRIKVLLADREADAGGELLVEAELAGAGEAGVEGVLGEVEGEDGRVA